MKIDKKTDTGKIIGTLLISIILIIAIWIFAQEYYEKKIENKNQYANIQNNVKLLNNQLDNSIIEEKKYIKEKIDKTYNGYTVCAKLEIPSISLETYILEDYSIQALNISVTKFWGANPNEIGNFCVVGHNFKNMFVDLKKLQIGDNLFIIDNTIGRVEYQIYSMDIVKPEDISCLSQETNYKEVTLITCTNDSKERIIVKAREVM